MTDVFNPTPTELAEIPIENQAAARDNTYAHFVHHTIRRHAELFKSSLDSFVECVERDMLDEPPIDTFRNPSKRFLRSAALFRRAMPDEFEMEIAKISSVSVRRFSAARFLKALARVDEMLGTLDEEIAQDKADSDSPEVRRQRQQQADQKTAEAIKVKALGYSGDRFFYSSNMDGSPLVDLTPRQHERREFFRLAILRYWEIHYGLPGSTDKISVDWDLVTSDLMQKARARGAIDPNKIRGRGAWIDNGEFVFNTGEYVVYDDGFRLPIADATTKYIYQSGEEIAVADEPLDDDERAAIVQVLKGFNWEDDTHYLMVVGWLLMATIAGALPFRCLIWLTALSGSGKSTIQKLFRTLFGHACHKIQGTTTIRGLAGVVGRDSLVFFYDEAEAAGEAGAARMKSFISELRSSVTGETDAVRAVGSSGGGQPRATRIESTGAITSISSIVSEKADVSRILLPKMLKIDLSTQEKRDRSAENKKIMAEQITPALGEKFLAFGIQNFARIRDTITGFVAHFRNELREDRLAEHNGTAFGCAFYFEEARVPSADEVAEWCARRGLTRSKLLEGVADRSEVDVVFEVMLTHAVQLIDGSNATRSYSIGELLTAVIRPGAIGNKIDREIAKSALSKHGIYIDTTNSRLLLGSSVRALQSVFSKCEFGNNFVDVFKTLQDEDDKKFGGPRLFSGAGRSRACVVKLDKIAPFLGLDDEEKKETEMPTLTPDCDIAEELFKRLMSSEIRAYTVGDRQVHERVRDMLDARTMMSSYPRVDQEDAGRALENVGIVADRNSQTGEWTGDLLIAIDHPRLQDLLSRGGYAAGRRYVDVFKSIAIATKRAVWFGGVEYAALVLKDRR